MTAAAKRSAQLDPSRLRRSLVRERGRDALDALPEAQGLPLLEALTAREVLREELWRLAVECAEGGSAAVFCRGAMELVDEARALDEAMEAG